MAIVKRTKSNGQVVFDARVRAGGRQISRTCATLEQAKIAEGELLALRRAGGLEQSEPEAEVEAEPDGTWTLAAIAAEWLVSDPGKRQGSRDTDDRALRKHILPALGHRPIGAITRSEVQQVVSAWSRELAPSTTVRTFSTLRAVVLNSIDAGVITGNPCRKVKMPRDDRPDRPALTVTQVQAIIAAVDPHWRPLLTTLALTGLRLGEGLGLRRRNLDLDNGLVHVREQLLPDCSGWVPPKSRAGVRTVPIPVVAVEALEKMLTDRHDDSPDSAVFVAKRGGLIGQQNLRNRVWSPAVERVQPCPECGVDVGQDCIDDKRRRLAATHDCREGLEWAVPHDLRRHFASIAVAAGADVKTLQVLLGHAKSSTSLDIYAKAMAGRDRTVADALGALW